MPDPTDLRDLKSDQWEQLQDLADRFENAWRDAEVVELAAFLPAAGDSLRPVALVELIKTDLEIRWRRGKAIDLEHYLVTYPELGPARGLPAQLIYEEYRVRQRYGDKPPLSLYQSRFPHQFETLQKLIEEHPLPTEATGTPTPPSPPVSPAGGKPTQTPGGKEVRIVGGRYKLQKRIGSGGFGEVYRAEAPGGVEVAIKVIYRPLDHEEAQRELQALEVIKNKRHPFLLQTREFWPEEDRLYIVMELADGSLRDRLKECLSAGQAGIAHEELLRYFRQAAEALDYLHSEQVLHRDVKPDNILLIKRYAKVADFGLVRLQQSQRASVSGSGTPAYMPPEIWRGKASPHSDQYSLAVTYTELRLNRRLFAGRDMMELMLEHLERAPDLSPLPEPEQQVLLKALAKDAAQRYPNCQTFVDALEQALGKSPREPVVAPLPPPAAEQPAGSATPWDDSVKLPGQGRRPAPPAAGPPSDPWRSDPAWKPGPPRRRRLLWLGIPFLLLALAGGVLARFVIWPPHPNETVTVEPRPDGPSPWVPDHYEPVPGAQVVKDLQDQSYYQRIQHKTVGLKDGQRLVFLLVLQQSPKDPPTFYLMENKVWNDLFAEFAGANEPVLRNSKWEQGGRADGKDLGIDGLGRHPVLNVRVEEADRFAQWLGGLLPTVVQWDKGAGRFERERNLGPFKEDGKENGKHIAIDRRKEGPLPVGKAANDVSVFGFRDLAGNGFEYTRNLLRPKGGLVPLGPEDKPGDEPLVLLRGRSYSWAKPLLFQDLDEADKKPELCQVQFYDKASPFTSFRVVIETRP